MNRCRLCVENPAGEAMIREIQFNHMLEDVFQMKFKDEVHFPGNVCDECVLNVQKFYVYKGKVHRTQQLLIEEQQRKQCDENIVNTDIYMKEQMLDETSLFACSTEVANTDRALEQYSPKIEQFEAVDVNDIPALDDVHKEQCNLDDLEDERSCSSEKKGMQNNAQRGAVVKKPSNQRAEENNRIKQFFSIVCEVCSHELPTFYQLQIHCRKTHNLRGFVKCCNQKFYRKFKILDHITFHLTPDAYRCELCKKNYRTRYTLQQHNNLCHTEREDRPFKCDKCNRTFAKMHQLKTHNARHIQVSCHLCGKVLSNVQALRVHLSHMHGKDENQICETCGETFRTKHALERHIRRHLGQQVDEMRQCPQCGIWLNSSRGLKNHTRNIHPEKVEVFECEICHQRCKNATTLYQHRKGVHAEDRYQCDFCDKRFKRKIYLKEHRASHTGQSLYSCDVCGLTTNSNANMYSHKKNKHPIEWRETQLKKQLAATAAGKQSLLAKQVEQN